MSGGMCGEGKCPDTDVYDLVTSDLLHVELPAAEIRRPVAERSRCRTRTMTAIKPNTDDANLMNIMMTTCHEHDRTYWSIHTARTELQLELWRPCITST